MKSTNIIIASVDNFGDALAAIMAELTLTADSGHTDDCALRLVTFDVPDAATILHLTVLGVTAQVALCSYADEDYAMTQVVGGQIEVAKDDTKISDTLLSRLGRAGIVPNSLSQLLPRQTSYDLIELGSDVATFVTMVLCRSEPTVLQVGDVGVATIDLAPNIIDVLGNTKAAGDGGKFAQLSHGGVPGCNSATVAAE